MTPGWEDLTANLALARADIAAAAPDATAAAEGEAYLMRVLTSSLAECCLGHVLTQNGLAQALPTRGFCNPDYLMSAAGIDPTRSYRIEGRINDSERAGIGLYSLRADGAPILAGYSTFDANNTDADGRFAFEFGADATGAGALPLTPETRALLVRIQHRSPAGTPAHLGLSGNPPPADLLLATGTADGALRQAGQITLGAIRQYLEWSRVTSRNPNRFTPPPEELGAAVQGVPDTCYALGYYALADGEWLEVLMPEGLTGYWSVYAGNHWMETLPGAGIHDLSAVPEADGRIRIRVGPSVPEGLPNRIDTRGRLRGVLICRMTAALDAPIPQAAVRRGGSQHSLS